MYVLHMWACEKFARAIERLARTFPILRHHEFCPPKIKSLRPKKWARIAWMCINITLCKFWCLQRTECYEKLIRLCIIKWRVRSTLKGPLFRQCPIPHIGYLYRRALILKLGTGRRLQTDYGRNGGGASLVHSHFNHSYSQRLRSVGPARF